MLMMLKEWKGDIEINGEKVDDLSGFNPVLGQIHIKLLPKVKNENLTRNSALQTHSGEDTLYRITVKQYMTRKAVPEFDFMAKWNNDNPMPMRTMEGYIEKETPGMVYMHLKGFVSDSEVNCLCCKKKLTNPVSQYYGIGPICLGKLGFTGDIDDIPAVISKVRLTHWSGWIIKSAIEQQEAV